MMPRSATSDLGYPLKLQGQYADLDMGFDTSRDPVVHRRHFDLAVLEGSEAAFDDHKTLVAASGVLQTDSVVVGLDDPFAVIFGGIRHRAAVDMQLAAFGSSQIAFEAAGSEHIDGPLGLSRMIFVAGQFVFEVFDDHLPVFGLPLGFFGVETKNVTSPSLTVADDNLFGLKVILEGGKRSSFTEHFPFDLGNGSHAAGQKIFATRLGQFRPIVRRVQARISNKHRPAEIPAAQIGANLGDGGDIGGIAGQNPTPYRNAVAGDGQGDHHLRRPVALFGVSEFAQGGVGLGIGVVILIIDMERGGGGVVENQINFQIEEVGGIEDLSSLLLRYWRGANPWPRTYAGV